MTEFEKIARAFHAARVADEATLDAVVAAEDARLTIGTGDPLVEIERAALKSLLKMSRADLDEYKQRDAIFSGVSERGDHGDLIPEAWRYSGEERISSI